MYTKPYIDCLPLVKIRRYSAKENYNTLIKDTTARESSIAIRDRLVLQRGLIYAFRIAEDQLINTLLD